MDNRLYILKLFVVCPNNVLLLQHFGWKESNLFSISLNLISIYISNYHVNLV